MKIIIAYLTFPHKTKEKSFATDTWAVLMITWISDSKVECYRWFNHTQRHGKLIHVMNSCSVPNNLPVWGIYQTSSEKYMDFRTVETLFNSTLWSVECKRMCVTFYIFPDWQLKFVCSIRQTVKCYHSMEKLISLQHIFLLNSIVPFSRKCLCGGWKQQRFM